MLRHLINCRIIIIIIIIFFIIIIIIIMGFVYRVSPGDFHSYSARRGNHEVMSRGTFTNIRLYNKLVGQTGPRTIHIPSGETVSCC